MECPSVDWENLFPKSKFMMSYIQELGEKLDRTGKRFDSVQKDTQSVNAKVEALSLVYALVWWTQVFEDIRSIVIEPYESWRDLKRLMRKRFVPPSYARDLHNKLQRLYQGSKSVEKYHKEMEMDLMRAQIRRARKPHWHSFSMGDPRLQHYGTLGELVHQAIKVHMQIKRKSASRKSSVGVLVVGKGRTGRKRELEERKAQRRRVTSHMVEGKPSPPLLLYP
ncbi:hypothetical protein CR513_17184, partial [Mucuna pruriens]